MLPGILLDGSQAFTELPTQSGRSLIERLERLFLAFGLDLFAGQRVAVLCVHSAQSDHVMSAQVRDGAYQHGFNAFALADFAAHLARDAFLRWLAHILQRMLDSRLWKDIQIRGLFDLHGQRLLEGAIKDRIASGVHKLGEKNKILFSESVGTPGKHESNR